MTCQHSGIFFLVLTCLGVLPSWVGTQEVPVEPEEFNQSKANLVALPSSAIFNQTKPNQIRLVRSANDLFIDVAAKYGVTHYGLGKAIKEAELHFKKLPQSTVTIHISGHHTIKDKDIPANIHHRSCIDLTNLYKETMPGNGGRLIIEGGGTDKTVLQADPGTEFLRGKNVYRLTVKDITFKRTRPLATQGIVTHVGQGFVKLRLEEGFPRLKDIYQKKYVDQNGVEKNCERRYIRKYKKVNGNCIIVDDDNNKQIPWRSFRIVKKTHEVEGFVRIKFKHPWQWAPYKTGDLIGVKSKMCNKNNNVYFFINGNDLVFQNVKFERQSRGVIRQIDNVRFSDITITRESKAWCLASSGGGPQIGQPRDRSRRKVQNVIIENLVAENLGDDPVALFNVEGGVIRNCDIKDSFARGIYLENSFSTVLQNNNLERCPLRKES